MITFIRRQFFNFGFRLILWSRQFNVVVVFGNENADAIFLAKNEDSLREAIEEFTNNGTGNQGTDIGVAS